MKLNAGSGRHYVPGWLNVDIANCLCDVRADLARLPLSDGCAERIFASHVLEHQEYFRVLPVMLGEFARVLAPGGELCVVGPDIERAVLMGEPRQILDAIVAWPADFNVGRWPQKTPPAGHAWTASGPFVEEALLSTGFRVESFTGRLPLVQAAGWPLDNQSDWQNCHICRY